MNTCPSVGYEADDVLATLCKWAKKRNLNAVVISPDKDMYQLIDHGVHIMHPKTKAVFGPEEVHGKYGVYPESFIDFQALIGDTSDNIPGVKGIGPKTAAAILSRYSTIEKLFEFLEPASIDDNSHKEVSLRGILWD